MPPAGTNGIFLSYRHADSVSAAGRLHEKLVQRFRQSPVFFDTTSLDGGDEWKDVITEEIDRSATVLVLIGRHWLEPTGTGGRSRLFDEGDEVRYEIEEAIRKRKRIIPVLVDGGTMPDRAELPEHLRELHGRQLVTLTNHHYASDFEILCRSIAKGFEPPAPRWTRRLTAGAVAGVGVLAVLGLLLWNLLPLSTIARPEPTPPTAGPPVPTSSPTPSSPTPSPPATETPLPGWLVPVDVQLVGSPTFDTMKKNGVVRIGINDDQPALSYRDPGSNRWSGFDIEIAKLVSAQLGFGPDRIDFKLIDSEDREDALLDGKVDLVVASYTINDKRQEVVSFAGPYYQAGQQLLVRKDETAVTDTKSLRGRKVCSVVQSTSIFRVETEKWTEPENIVGRTDYGRCVQELLSGTVDAVTTDDVILAGYVARYPDRLELIGPALSQEPYGVGLTKNDVVLRTKINDILQAAADNGTWRILFDDTIGKLGISAGPPPIVR